MSTIQTNCPHCMQQLAADDSILGQYVDCPSCGKRFRLQAKREDETVGEDSVALKLSMTGIELLILLGGADEDDLGILALFGIVPIILGLIFTCILHYRCWKAIPEGFARLTPGKAVGYLFIPFFNLYWSFPSFSGLGSDCAVVAAKKGLRGFSSLRGLGLTYAILWTINMLASSAPGLGFFTGVAAFVIWLLFYQNVTRLLNGLAKAESEPKTIE